MFIHAVLFQIQPKEVGKYNRDNRIWASYAKKAKGFIAYFTMQRGDHQDQYASVYQWQKKKDHDQFMKKYHDWLVVKSKAKVKVLGYYNLKSKVQVCAL